MHLPLPVYEDIDEMRCHVMGWDAVDGQNFQTQPHTLCWTPAPPNLNVPAHVLAKVTLRVWFLSSIGANAPRVTSTLNWGGRGGCIGWKGFEYFVHLQYQHAAHPSWYRLALWCFHIFWSPNFYCGNIRLHAVDLMPNCAQHYFFTGQCNLSVSCMACPILSSPWCATYRKMREALPFHK